MFNHDLSKVQSQTGNPGGYARPYDLRNVVRAQGIQGEIKYQQDTRIGPWQGVLLACIA